MKEKTHGLTPVSPYVREEAAAAYLGLRSRRSLQNMRWLGTGPESVEEGWSTSAL